MHIVDIIALNETNTFTEIESALKKLEKAREKGSTLAKWIRRVAYFIPMIDPIEKYNKNMDALYLQLRNGQTMTSAQFDAFQKRELYELSTKLSVILALLPRYATASNRLSL